MQGYKWLYAYMLYTRVFRTRDGYVTPSTFNDNDIENFLEYEDLLSKYPEVSKLTKLFKYYGNTDLPPLDLAFDPGRFSFPLPLSNIESTDNTENIVANNRWKVIVDLHRIAFGVIPKHVSFIEGFRKVRERNIKRLYHLYVLPYASVYNKISSTQTVTVTSHYEKLPPRVLITRGNESWTMTFYFDDRTSVSSQNTSYFAALFQAAFQDHTKGTLSLSFPETVLGSPPNFIRRQDMIMDNLMFEILSIRASSASNPPPFLLQSSVRVDLTLCPSSFFLKNIQASPGETVVDLTDLQSLQVVLKLTIPMFVSH